MTSRCPKCGRNNYGDVKKCSFCGSPLVYIPGEEIPQISEEDVQAKLSTLKVERIRNPVLIGGGGIVGVVGVFLAVILFLIFMMWVFSPTDIEPYTEQGSLHYDVPGGEEYLFGEITLIVKDGEQAQLQSYGYEATYYAVEIDGDGVDKRERADDDANTALEPDVWVYSEEKFGDVGDQVLIKVKSERNDFGELRAVSMGKAGWGGSGWFSAGWIFILPGFLMFLAGAAILTFGLVGKADRSMERLMEEDKEFRRQQLMLREAARRQMESQQQQQKWASDGIGHAQIQPGEAVPVDPNQPQPVPAAPLDQTAYPPQEIAGDASAFPPAAEAAPQPVQQFEASSQAPPMAVPQPAPAMVAQNAPAEAPQVQLQQQPPTAPLQ